MSSAIDTAVDEVVAALRQSLGEVDETALRRRIQRLVDGAGSAGRDAGAIAELLAKWVEVLGLRASAFGNEDAAVADLSSWLEVRKRGGASTRDAIGWFIEHYAATLTVLGLLATAFYGLAYATFYNAVDTTPEQVGVTTTQILAQSAVGGVAFVALGGLFLLLVMAPLIPVFSAFDVVDGYAKPGEVAGLACLGLFSSGVFLVLQATLSDLSVGEAVYTVVVLLFFPFLVSLRYNRTRGLHLAPLHFRSGDFRAAYLGSAAVVLLLLGFLTFFNANVAGDKASEGERIDSLDVIGVPYLGLKAEPAFLTWSDAVPDRFNLPRCVLLLGHSGGSVTVYDSQQRRTMQVPENAVIVTVRQDRTSCSAPIVERRPAIERQADGDLACDPGVWNAYPRATYRYLWIRDGEERRLSKQSAFDFHERDRGHSFRCAVEAETNLGADIAYSRYFVRAPERVSLGRPLRQVDAGF